MVTKKDYLSPIRPTWCPGCGDFGILNATKQALVNLELEPHQVLFASGIGCGSKLPDYIRANGYTSLHGRPIPVAQGVHLANHDLKVIVVAGDGDTYGIGGNHLIHAMRRNPDITIMVQDNAVYGLTKGQYSPRSPEGFLTKTSPPPKGALEKPVNPIALALGAGATFVARTFAGDYKHATATIEKAIQHNGCALVDIFQPCVTFNPDYSYDFYRERVYKLSEEDYDSGDIQAAWQKALEWGDRIPIGIVYQTDERPSYEDQVISLNAGPLVKQEFKSWTEEDYQALAAEFV